MSRREVLQEEPGLCAVGGLGGGKRRVHLGAHDSILRRESFQTEVVEVWCFGGDRCCWWAQEDGFLHVGVDGDCEEGEEEYAQEGEGDMVHACFCFFWGGLLPVWKGVIGRFTLGMTWVQCGGDGCYSWVIGSCW